MSDKQVFETVLTKSDRDVDLQGADAKIVENGDEMLVVFSDAMLEDLGWCEGDTLVWTLEDGRLTLCRGE